MDELNNMPDKLPYERLLDLSRRRALRPDEERELEAWLASNPAAAQEWELERALSHALDRLPDLPLSSNFEARVMGAVRREALPRSSVRSFGFARWRDWLRRWLPRTALAAIAFGTSLFSYHYAQAERRAELARSVEVVTSASTFPSRDILWDFEAIRALNRNPGADAELLNLLE